MCVISEIPSNLSCVMKIPISVVLDLNLTQNGLNSTVMKELYCDVLDLLIPAAIMNRHVHYLIGILRIKRSLV